jgi:hypothetical protein
MAWLQRGILRVVLDVGVWYCEGGSCGRTRAWVQIRTDRNH